MTFAPDTKSRTRPKGRVLHFADARQLKLPHSHNRSGGDNDSMKLPIRCFSSRGGGPPRPPIAGIKGRPQSCSLQVLRNLNQSTKGSVQIDASQSWLWFLNFSGSQRAALVMHKFYVDILPFFRALLQIVENRFAPRRPTLIQRGILGSPAAGWAPRRCRVA